MQSKYSTPFLSFSSVETHSFDGQTYLYKGQEGWVVVWQGAEVEGGPFKTRQPRQRPQGVGELSRPHGRGFANMCQ